jgi:holin-like protein
MRSFFTLVWQAAILVAISRGCNWLVKAVDVPVPGNVLGVVVLFTLLCLGVVKLDHVARAADFLLKHLVFFFIPITVGLIEWGEVFVRYGLILLVAVVVSSIVPLWLVGVMSERLGKGGRP